MEEQQKLIECNSCKKSFPADQIQIYPRIVRKDKIRAIAYCFKCPECGQEYICFFKDSEVNAMFRKGQVDQAQHRMAYLKEIFTNDHSV